MGIINDNNPGLRSVTMQLVDVKTLEKVPFIRVLTFDENNNLESTDDYALDGTPYTPVGIVRREGRAIVDRADIFAMLRLPGFSSGETYDSVTFADVTPTEELIQFDNNGVCQFQIQINENGGGTKTIMKRSCEFFLLKEDGDFLLKEDSAKIKVAGLIPV